MNYTFHMHYMIAALGAFIPGTLVYWLTGWGAVALMGSLVVFALLAPLAHLVLKTGDLATEAIRRQFFSGH